MSDLLRVDHHAAGTGAGGDDDSVGSDDEDNDDIPDIPVGHLTLKMPCWFCRS